MAKYHRKQKKQAQDEFVDFWTKTFAAVEPYARAILITVVSAVAVWFCVFGISAYFEHKSQASAEQFGRAVKIYDSDLLGDEAAPKTDEENPIPRYKTEKERADATFAALDELDKKWHGSDVARNAIVFRAGVLYDLGRFDEAVTSYRKFLDELKGKDVPLVSMAKEGLGLCLEAQNKLDDALAAYQSLEPREGAKGDFYRDRALYDQARIYKKKGDKTKAAALYNQVLTKMPQSPLRDEIQSQLAVLEAP